MRTHRLLGIVLFVAFLGRPSASAQDLGHRLIGTLGTRAGEQPSEGLYLADRFVYYGASTLRDRTGAPLLAAETDDPRLVAFGNAVGLSASFFLHSIQTYVSFGAALPFAYVSVRTDRPEATLDRAGLGDVFVQPLGLGWRLPHVDVVARYGLYVPTGIFRVAGGRLSSGQLAHQLGLGATVFFDTERRYRVSARVSYDIHHTKMDVDVRRGDTLQLQGGVGALLFDLLDVGVVGAALWQVRDDRGEELPELLRGIRERAFGIGAELGIVVAAIAGRVGLRYLHELGARARPEGHVLVLELAIQAWQPESPGRDEA